MYLLKHVVSIWTAPLAFALALTVIGVVCRVFGRRKAAGSALAAAALVVYAGSSGLVSTPALRYLETRYPAMGDAAHLPDVRFVVVLGSDYMPDETRPITANIDSEGLVRIVEGVRLMRRLPDARLILTGGPIPGRGQPSLGNARLARELGVPESSIVVLNRALDTAGEARDVKAFLNDAPFLLVTSAYHMPRAIKLMELAGTRPVAAPTGHRGEGDSLGWDALRPSSGALANTERVVHEYLGLAAIALGLGGAASLD